jgi:mRNA-degrading endonuclease toxin of MazEF toxin-antitoxin module
MSPRPGEVWLADLGLAAKTRLVVVVSRYDPDPPRALVLFVPLTTRNRHSSYEIALPRLSFLDRDSVANVLRTRVPADSSLRTKARHAIGRRDENDQTRN